MAVSPGPASRQAFDKANRTVVVSNLPTDVDENEITIYFQKAKHGGDNADEVEFGEDGTVAFVTFDAPEVVQSILNHPQPVILGNKVQVQSYESWYLSNYLTKNEEISKQEGNHSKGEEHLFEPTYDRSILLVRNLNPNTGKDTIQDFIESTKHVEVLKIVLGVGGKAIVILKNEIGEDKLDSRSKDDGQMLESFPVSLEFAPLSKGIRIINIPQQASLDAIRFKFSNPKVGGGKVTDIMFDKDNGVANIYFESYSVVSTLVKETHTLNKATLTVFPYYHEFDDIQDVNAKTTEFCDSYVLAPQVMDFISTHYDDKFGFQSMKYDRSSSTLHYGKDVHDFKLAQEFKDKLKKFLKLFVKQTVKIPKNVFAKVKETIESKLDEFKTVAVDFDSEDSSVIFVGENEDVSLKKHLVADMVDKCSEEARTISKEFPIGISKLTFLNFIDYFNKVMTEFPEVQIYGMDSKCGKVTLVGMADKIRNLESKISEDLMNISETEVKLSDRQKEFLKTTDCQIMNDQLKKDDAMVILEGELNLCAKMLSFQKNDANEEKKLIELVYAGMSEKCGNIDNETASFLLKSAKVKEFKKEQLDQHQVLISIDSCKIWIVCEESKMTSAEKELTSFLNKNKMGSSTFGPIDQRKFRFLKEHCWNKVIKKVQRCKAEGVVVKNDIDSIEIKGTQTGRTDMITFLEMQTQNVLSMEFSLNEPGMEKLMNTGGTKSYISDLEKKHKCVIERQTSADTNGLSTINHPYSTMSFANDKEIKMATGHKISIFVGDIAQQKVDVIVNTTNEKVDLNGNPCGQALLKVAGKELQSECKKIGALQRGEMARTGPAKLKCKHVFHVRLPHWDDGKGAAILQNLIQECLQSAEKYKLASIAIPAIGTGKILQFPRTEVARILFEKVINYLTANPHSSINDVRFIAYDKDQETVDAFLEAVQEIKTMAFLAPVRTREKADGSLELSLAYNSLKVQVINADISHEKTDLIMHVIGSDFCVKGGVAKAIKSAGGDSIIHECKAMKTPPLFSTQYTKAGKLAVRQIAHVIAPDSIKEVNLKKCLDSFFDDVSKRNITSVSFSAIGAGVMRFSESISANFICENLSRIAKSKSSSLRLVRIVILDKPKFIKFKDATKAYFATTKVATPSSPKPMSLPSNCKDTTTGKEGIQLVKIETSTSESPKQPTSESPKQPTSESPKQPTSESQKQPTSESGKQPTSESPKQPTSESPKQPTSESPKQLTSESPKQPTSESPKQPTSESPKQPTSESPKQPTSESPKQPTSESQKQPTSESPKQPTSESPKQPTSESQKQPTSESQKQPTIKVYSDDVVYIEKAWEELKTYINQYIQVKTVNDEAIKKITKGDLEKLRKSVSCSDVDLKMDQNKGAIIIRGHITDILRVQEEIYRILSEVKENESKVPSYWNKTPSTKKFVKFNLSTSEQEYKDIQAEFNKTAKKKILSIERIQNKEIYEMYNVKRQAMMKKYTTDFAGKEMMLFHGTSFENLEKINADGLNRNYAGQHAIKYGKGVYFARDAGYSLKYSRRARDGNGFRYMYYARVLVGEYTVGNSSMLVPPNKPSADPNERYDSVVNDVNNPSIYVMFKDYEYYTEYLITFK